MRERALRLRAKEQGRHRKCLGRLAQEEAVWGIMVQAAQERSSAKPWMTWKVEVP